MSFRMKSKYYITKTLTENNYDPETPVVPGSQGWHLRIAANNLYKAGHITEYEDAKREFFTFLNKKSEKGRKNASSVLNLDLKHGDMVVMHGKDLQRIYEVSIQLFQPTIKLTPFSMVYSQETNCATH